MPPLEMPLTDLIGAFGDISWATHVPASMGEDGVVAEVLALASDSELVLHRLLLSGYTKVRDIGAGASIWRSLDDAMVRVIEVDAEWGRLALGAASRNRDRRGAPHLTLPFVIYERLTRGETARDELDALRSVATDAELSELRELSEIYPPGTLAPELERYDTTERG